VQSYPVKIVAGVVTNAGRAISTQDLIDKVWDNDSPASAVSALYSYISRLRHCLRDDDDPRSATIEVTSTSGAYRADFNPGQADIHRFRALAASARESARGGDTERAVRLLRLRPLSVSQVVPAANGARC
jgi:DNA-binding SARP family transcriptional activator